MSKSLLDDWNDPHNRKMRELYAEQDRKMQAQDGNRDAADLAALRAENARLRGIIDDMLAYAQDKTELELSDSSGRIVIRMSLDAYRAALA